MRAAILLAVCGLAFGQTADQAYGPLTRAYEALRSRDYDAAISWFLKGIQIAPQRTSVRKDLAYTYLKIGENVLARDQFAAVMSRDPADTQVAMEYAYLCYETRERREARRVFDRIRKTGNHDAERAFQNIDAPLAAGLARWKRALEMGADTFSSHFELAALAEERDDLELAAVHFERAWRLLPGRRSVLVDLGQVWKALSRTEDANAALLAASRGGEPRAAEAARELLPQRYPWVSEFRRALELEPSNTELRRELGFLLLKMGLLEEGEAEFRILSHAAPDDLLAATQLGFLLHARGASEEAQTLFDHVMAGDDEDLANRVRAVLRIPQLSRDETKAAAVDAREMAERSMKAGFLKDAARYLLVAHESDPADHSLTLKLGWTFNMLRQDAEAIQWFDMARKSPDRQVSSEAASAYRNLRRAARPFRTSAWIFPLYSRRWRDLFAYGQIKTELKTSFPIKPYVSLRFVGDVRGRIGREQGLYLSESAFVLGVGVSTALWHGLSGWAEAGSAVGYLSRHMIPDYRAGVSYVRGFGRLSAVESPGWFAELNSDGVFASRFGNDTLFYQLGRTGYTTKLGSGEVQLYWNAGFTADQKREAWANFWEAGPGFRFSGGPLPGPAYFTLNFARGGYLIGSHQGFSDLRMGFWYALSR